MADTFTYQSRSNQSAFCAIFRYFDALNELYNFDIFVTPFAIFSAYDPLSTVKDGRQIQYDRHFTYKWYVKIRNNQ